MRCCRTPALCLSGAETWPKKKKTGTGSDHDRYCAIRHYWKDESLQYLYLQLTFPVVASQTSQCAPHLSAEKLGDLETGDEWRE
jgi:hypothetical protein